MRSPREFALLSIPLHVIAALVLAVPAPAQCPPLPPLPDRPLRLADFLALSEARQPSLIVARARLAAAQSKLASLESLDGPLTRMRQDMPIRRGQAQLGIDAAKVELDRMQSENRYVVTRAYLSVLYARVQRNVLDDIIGDLKHLRERVRTSIEKKERAEEWTTATVDLITLNLRRIEARRVEAERGIALALAALRESINVGPNVPLDIADEPIPQPSVQVSREAILAAVSRRGEVIEASLASDAASLEVDAQGARCRRGSVNTFAAGTDLHAKHVPQPIYGEQFRPGGVPLAMPTVLVGPREGRVETAQDLSIQAAAVAQKTRNLAVLEAEEAYEVWLEWSQKAVLLAEAAQSGSRLARQLHDQFYGTLSGLIPSLLPESLLAAQTRTDYNEALFRQAIALAALERVTGGAFCANLANGP